MDPAALERYAELIVRFAANVQPGQIVEVGSEIGKEELTRAVAASAYRAGARHVTVNYDDLHLKRARILHAPDDALGYAPDWVRRQVQELNERHGASIYLSGAAEPGILDGLDGDRIGRDRSPEAVDWQDAINARTVNWTVVPAPTPAWAGLVHPSLEPAEALERLWEQVLHVCRMDEDDPVAAPGAARGRRRRADTDGVPAPVRPGRGGGGRRSPATASSNGCVGHPVPPSRPHGRRLRPEAAREDRPAIAVPHVHPHAPGCRVPVRADFEGGMSMRYGVLGTGQVGRALAGRLVEVGHEVRMGSRTSDNEAAAAWLAEAGAGASQGTFADAAEFGQTVMNCTNGPVALDALAAAGAENLAGKVLIDVANPLTFETGRLTLTVCNTDSLGEQIQRSFPDPGS